MRLALVTKADLPDGSEDDRAVLAPLAALGVEAAPCVWDDPRVRWASFDGALLRSTWDYHLRRAEFLSWAERVEGACGLWNPPHVLRWNSDKSYLFDLRARGVPIVPTRRCETIDEALATAAGEGWERAVVKPAVSAGGYRTYLLTPGTLEHGEEPWKLEPPTGEVLVQPYVAEVERSGERSLVYFDGAFSHAFLRAPLLAKGSLLTEGSSVDASPEELRLGATVLEAAPAPALYARVDLVRGPSGTPWLMELEMIEPFLGLRSRPGAPERFAACIEQRLRRRPERGAGRGSL